MSTLVKPVVIVDKHGNPIGTSPNPGEALKAGHIRLISRVMLKNSKGEYLLQKRSMTVPNWPGYWDHTAAGHVDEGEVAEQAAYRELKEEMGITGVTLKEVATYYTSYPQPEGLPISKCFNHVFWGDYEGDSSSIVFETEEVGGAKWFSVEEIKDLVNKGLTTDGLIALVEKDLI